MDEIDGAHDVRVDHMQDSAEFLIKNAVPQPHPGVRHQHIDRPAANRLEKLVDTFKRREVGLHDLNVFRKRTECYPGIFDFKFVGGDHEVIPVSSRAFGNFEANAG